MYDDYAADEYGMYDDYANDENTNEKATDKKIGDSCNGIPVVISDQLPDSTIHSIPCRIKYTGLLTSVCS